MRRWFKSSIVHQKLSNFSYLRGQFQARGALGAPALLAALLLAIPARAQDVEQQQLCYAWLTLTPAGVLAQLKPYLADAVRGDRELERALPRITRCMRGAVEALQPQVRDQCMSTPDPRPIIGEKILAAVGICTGQAMTKPEVVLPYAITNAASLQAFYQSLATGAAVQP